MLISCELDTIPQKNSHKSPQFPVIYGCFDGYTVTKRRRSAVDSGALCLFAGPGRIKDKGFAVNALGNGRILFVGTDHNAVKGAEIAAARVVCALGNGTCDRMIGLLLFHFRIPSLRLIRDPARNPVLVLSGTAGFIHPSAGKSIPAGEKLFEKSFSPAPPFQKLSNK